LQLVEARCGLRAGHTGGERDGDDGAGGHGEETLHFVRSPSWVASPLSTLPTSPSSACSCESIDVRSDCTVGSSVDGAEDEAVLAAVAVDDDAAGVAEWLLPPHPAASSDTSATAVQAARFVMRPASVSARAR